MSLKVQPKDVIGHRVDLSDGRIVFVGSHKDHADTTFVAFKNAEGKDTCFVLSPDARVALMDLLSNPAAGQEGQFPHSPSADHTNFSAAWTLFHPEPAP